MHLWMRFGLLALATAVGAGFLWHRQAGPPLGEAAAVVPVPPAPVIRHGLAAHAARQDAAPEAPPTLDEIRARVKTHPSFRHSVATGDWCVIDGRLLPCYGLRQRFDYHLLAIGIVPVDDIRRLVEDDARQAHGDTLAAAIMKVWDNYRAVRTYVPVHTFDPQDRASWSPVFEELRLVRRRLLGQAWADAFFGEEERDFRAHAAPRAETTASPDEGPDIGAPVPQLGADASADAVYAERAARYGRAAADRLARLDEEWANWEHRLEAAKAEQSRLAQQPELSAPQRNQAMQAYVQAHFKPDEIRRVQALLHL